MVAQLWYAKAIELYPLGVNYTLMVCKRLSGEDTVALTTGQKMSVTACHIALPCRPLGGVQLYPLHCQRGEECASSSPRPSHACNGHVGCYGKACDVLPRPPGTPVWGIHQMGGEVSAALSGGPCTCRPSALPQSTPPAQASYCFPKKFNLKYSHRGLGI